MHSIENEAEIIETDEQTRLEDQNDDGENIYIFDPVKENIEIVENLVSVYEYLPQLKKGKIDIHPNFQRNSVWTNEKKCRFIESVLLNSPLPPIYLNETVEATYVVIDGLQRSTALRKEVFSFDFTNGDSVQERVCCEPHIKLCYNDNYPGDSSYSTDRKIYFHEGKHL